MGTYLGGRDSPDFVVVRSHEDVGETSSHHSHDPLIKVLRLISCGASGQSSINHAVNALDLFLLRQHGDIVLKWVGNPELFAANVRDTLVGIPILFLW
jgi:hypothetical protein